MYLTMYTTATEYVFLFQVVMFCLMGIPWSLANIFQIPRFYFSIP